MNLAPDGAERDLAAAARAAFAHGAAPPSVATLAEACVIAAVAGRESPDRSHLWAAVAELFGWAGGGSVTVAFGVTGDRCDHVPRAGVAEVVLVVDPAGAVAEIDLAATARTSRPTIDDPHACRVELPSGWASARRAHDVDRAVTRSLVLVAADCAGAAEAAFEASVERVRDRRMRGGTLADLQVVRHVLADCAIGVTACRDAVADAAARADRDEPAADVRLAAVRAKAVSVDRGRRVTADALRLAGGVGFLDEHPWQRWYRRVKAAEPILGSPRDHRAELALASLARFR